MYNENEQDLYYLHKLLLALMFDKEDNYKKIKWIYDLDVLAIFRDLIYGFTKENSIRHQVKDNICKIMVDGREIKDENYKERIKIINNIIINMNLQKKDNSFMFYLGELSLRGIDKKELKKYTVDDVLEEVPYIEESICNDFSVILSHGKNLSDEEFEKQYLPSFIDNDYYYESLNMILHECPSMFKNKVFARRVNQVLGLNKDISRNYKNSHKQIKRLVRKYI